MLNVWTMLSGLLAEMPLAMRLLTIIRLPAMVGGEAEQQLLVVKSLTPVCRLIRFPLLKLLYTPLALVLSVTR